MIELSKVTKCYGVNCVLNNVNYNFREHGLVALLGESGCGKTTLFHLLAGFDRDYEGSILVGGCDLQSLSIEGLSQYRSQNIGFVFQNYHLLTGYSVYENILLACSSKEETIGELNLRIEMLLKRVDLLDKRDENIEHLSGGQKQRVGIVRALINHPKILLADEPTGALDHENAMAIMKLLKEIAQDYLVIVITHDASICDDVDEILQIQDGTITSNALPSPSTHSILTQNKTAKHQNYLKPLKNFKLHILAYLMVALAIAVGTTVFVLSLSSSNILQTSIDAFKEKNTAFNNGQVKSDTQLDELYNQLLQDSRLEHVYRQYKIEDITLSLSNQSVIMKEKFPMAKSIERMSYGIMPRKGQNEIALSPSLAKKFGIALNELLGKTIELHYQDDLILLQVSGIYGAGYDDFYVSGDIEQRLYQDKNPEDAFALSFDVKNFEDIVAVNDMLETDKIEVSMAFQEVEALQSTFQNIQNLFFIVSIFILGIAFFLSIILLIKIQRTRIREVGLLAALGYQKRQIQTMLLQEQGLLILMATCLHLFCLTLATYVCAQVQLALQITVAQGIGSLLFTIVSLQIIGAIATLPLLKVEPADALKA